MSCNITEAPNSWLYKKNVVWLTIVSRLYTFIDTYYVNSDNVSAGGARASSYVYPTLYLNSNIKITSGDGSSENPYRLSI